MKRLRLFLLLAAMSLTAAAQTAFEEIKQNRFLC